VLLDMLLGIINGFWFLH